MQAPPDSQIKRLYPIQTDFNVEDKARDFSEPRDPQFIGGGNEPMSNDTSFKTEDANKLLPGAMQ